MEDVEAALTTRVVRVMREKVCRRLNAVQALAARDAMAKIIYQRMWHWMVDRINTVIKANVNSRTRTRSIGVLDIYGFEIFETNGFEQVWRCRQAFLCAPGCRLTHARSLSSTTATRSYSKCSSR